MSHSQVGKSRPASYWSVQKARTMKNKKDQRARHSARHPKDEKSLAGAKRWVDGVEYTRTRRAA